MKRNSYSKEQKTYMLAKANFDVYKDREREIEQAYIAKHSIVNPDGTVPSCVIAIENEEVFERANEETCATCERSGLYEEMEEARRILAEAENALIAYGLRILPAGLQKERETLEKAASRSVATREKLIDLTFKLDARTVKI